VKTALKRAPGWIFHHAGWKLLSLGVAIILWAFVATEPELALFASVRLEFKNLPDELEISSQPVDTVSLELRGPSGNLRNLNGPAAPEVVLDMSSVEPGQRTFPIDSHTVRLERGVHLVRAIPSEVRFTFEQRRRRFVPVLPRFTGQGQHGYTVAGWTIDPQQVEVVGPASHVARLASVATDPVDVSSVVGSSEFRVNAYLDSPFLRFASSPQITVKVTMKKE
jgi:YbbR domain-containing protein